MVSDGFTDRGRGIRFPSSSPRSLTVEHLGTVSGRFELLSADHFPKNFRGGDRSMWRAIVQVFFILGFFGFFKAELRRVGVRHVSGIEACYGSHLGRREEEGRR